MPEAFTIGDSIKYSCTHEGKKLIIRDWELFDKDWGLLKEKAKNLDALPDRLLEIIDKQLAHQGKQEQIDYSRGFTKGLEWTKTEIMKVFGR